MIDPQVTEDVHFLIDSAPPDEVEHILRCLSQNGAYSNEELRTRMLNEWHFDGQKSLSFSSRRLVDLGLACKSIATSGRPGYVLSRLGAKVRSFLSTDTELYDDLMHFLHYASYCASRPSRKLFWSYRQCCSIVWDRKQIPAVPELVSLIQAEISTEFPDFYARRIGGNFNAGGVAAWKAWLGRLAPPPFPAGSRTLLPRQRDRFELALLALDHVYETRGYRYGDPVVLADDLLDEVARVFFLDPECCRQLLSLASKVTRSLKLSDTFAGTSITLLAPYKVDNI